MEDKKYVEQDQEKKEQEDKEGEGWEGIEEWAGDKRTTRVRKKRFEKGLICFQCHNAYNLVYLFR